MYRSKYHSQKVETEFGRFDSKRECKRWYELFNLQQEGVISDLQRQVEFVLIPAQRDENFVHIRPIKYVADFVYKVGTKEVVEDAKGFCTPEYRIKKKLMLWVHGITVKEV